MIATLEYAETINNTTLPPITSNEKREKPERQLTALYVKENKSYEIECKNSPCRTKCHFLSSEFGEAIFDRESESFIASTKSLNDHYYKYLTRTIKNWKNNFPNF
ncbi:hypothetical protein ESA94_19370 [Lacibacter luteus]|uniref:Uncharacterized protein n=1 Tax=Lacibacter luteus TaxID=2508719 RepID=A0A4Q1CF41_9BACT|nr:hypothetical protein [Lacibacter luteus]RXK58172.1 hypothetical protein ESA94_19370 [Lacibacter luteus]